MEISDKFHQTLSISSTIFGGIYPKFPSGTANPTHEKKFAKTFESFQKFLEKPKNKSLLLFFSIGTHIVHTVQTEKKR